MSSYLFCCYVSFFLSSFDTKRCTQITLHPSLFLSIAGMERVKERERFGDNSEFTFHFLSDAELFYSFLLSNQMFFPSYFNEKVSLLQTIEISPNKTLYKYTNSIGFNSHSSINWSELTSESDPRNKWECTKTTIKLPSYQRFPAHITMIEWWFWATNIRFVLCSSTIHWSIAIVAGFCHFIIHAGAFRHRNAHRATQTLSSVSSGSCFNVWWTFVTAQQCYPF